MKDSAPPNPVVAPTDPPSAEEGERDAVVALATRLGATGGRPAVQPTAIAPAQGATLAAHAAAAALGAALGWLWPALGLALIGATGWSAWRVANGQQGWVRYWVPRSVGHNVVLWRGREPGSARPCLLVAAPLDAGPGRAPLSGAWIYALAAPGALAALGVLIRWFALDLGRTLLLGGALGLLVNLLAGLIHAAARPWRQGPGPANGMIDALRSALDERSPAHLDVVLAWITGGASFGDGLETFLRNNAHKLPAHQTRVIALAPARPPDLARLVNVEGRWRRRAVDPVIGRAAAEVGLPVTGGVTPSVRAMDAGWRAATLLVGEGAPLTPLSRLVAQLDLAAGEDRW